MTRPIKVGILVSYDYELIKNSLPPVYEYADRIVLAVDKDGKTWSGNSFHIDDSFWQWVKEFDTERKIEIYSDSFYVEGLTSVQCDTRERNMLGKFMGEGGWHVQIDADEYFIDFKHFVDFLHYLDKKKKHVNCVYQEWLVLYKRVSAGYLFIKDGSGTALATTKPEYVCCRIIENEKKILYPQRILHDSWARTEQDLLLKLKNWGHNHDFDTDGYFHFWKAIDEKNYMFVRNFHPYSPDAWDKLEYVESKELSSLLRYLKERASRELLNVDNPESKISRIVKLCIPPIFPEILKYFKFKRRFNQIKKNINQL